MPRRLDRALRLALESLEDRSVPAAGVLDSTFDGDGRVGIDVNPIGQGVTPPGAMTRQPDGKLILAVGSARGGLGGLQVTRLYPDGTPDPTFSPLAGDTDYDGGDGTAWLGSNPYFISDANAVVVQPDGGIVVVHDTTIVRLTADGRPDPTFGAGGYVRAQANLGGVLNSTLYGGFAAAAAQLDGRIILAGTDSAGSGSPSDFIVARLTAGGAWDTTFGTTGGGATRTNISGNDTGRAVVIHPTAGTILVAGSARPGTYDQFAVVRYLSTGVLDPSFGSGGVVTHEYLTAVATPERAYGVALDADGPIVLAGSGGVNNNPDFLIARLNENGSKDLTFGTNGYRLTDVGVAASSASSVQLDGQERIVAGGWATPHGYAVARLTPTGQLDTTFAGTGYLTIQPGATLSGTGEANTPGDLLVRDDNSILMSGRLSEHYPYEGMPGGTTPSTVVGVGVWALTDNGAPNTAFAGDGFGEYHPLRDSNDQTRGLVLQPDGKVIVVGSSSQYFASYADFAVARLNPDGSRDTTFGGDGDVAVAFSSTSYGSEENATAAAVVQPDLKIVVVGSVDMQVADEKMGVVRLLPDGSLDPSFGNGGRVVVNPSTLADNLFAVALQPDGKILAAGSSRVGTSDDLAVIRLNPDGTLDATFAGTGVWTGSPLGGSAVERARSILLQPDGKILIVGGSSTTTGSVIVRLNPDGTPDTTFDGDGFRTLVGFPAGGTFTMTVYDLNGVALDPAGRAVVVGRVLNNNVNGGGGGFDFFAARLLPNGALDPTFDGDGFRSIQVGPGLTTDEAEGVVIQQNGRIFITGTSGPTNVFDVGAVRLNADGSTDTTFGGGGWARFDLTNFVPGNPFTAPADKAQGMVLEPGGNVLVAVSTQPADLAVIRIIGDQLPTDLTLTPASIAENAGANAVVGALTTADPDAGDTHTYTLVPGAGGDHNAEFTIVGNQLWAQVSFDHETTPTRTVRIRTIDQTGSYYEEAFSVAVLDANEPPTAFPDAYATDEDEGLSGSVLENDTDPEDDTLGAQLVSFPKHGTLLFLTNGTFTYSPDPDWNGEDSFAYRAVDSQGAPSAAAFVTLTVTPVDDPAVATPLGAVTDEDVAISVTLTGDDGDPELTQPLTFGLQLPPQHGTLSGFNPATGEVTYTPDANYNGPDSFTFVVNDGTGWSEPAVVGITIASVNDAPEVQNTRLFVGQNGTLTGASLFDTACDSHRGAPGEGNGPFTIQILTHPAHGQLEVLPDGRVNYTPVFQYVGQDAFTYMIFDILGAAASAKAAVAIFPTVADVLDTLTMTATEWDYAIGGVPDFDQRRAAGALESGGYAYPVTGLPGDGGMYCQTVSAANWLAYVGNRGYPGVFSGTATDWTPGNAPIDDYDRYETVTGVLAEMGEVFDIDPEKGGGVSMTEMTTWLRNRGLDQYFTYSTRGVSSLDDLEGIVESAATGGLVSVMMGYYRTTDYLLEKYPKRYAEFEGQPADAYWWVGGHQVSLTAANIDYAGSSPVIHFGYHDPALYGPFSKENKVTQSQFSQANYRIQPGTHLFGRRKETGTTTVDGEEVPTYGPEADPVSRTRGLVVGYHTGNKPDFITGYTVLKPEAGLTWDVTGIDLSFLFPAAVLAHGSPVVTYPAAEGRTVRDAVMVPDRVFHPYVTEGSDTVWRINQVTGESSPWVTGLNAPRRLAHGGRGQTTFVLDATSLAAVDSSGVVRHRISLPEPGIDAITYDDFRGGLAAFSSATGTMYTYGDDLRVQSAVSFGADIVPGAADARTQIGVDPNTGAYWLHKAGATGVVKLTPGAGGVERREVTVGLACGHFVDVGVDSDDTGGADGMTVDGRGRVLLTIGGRVAQLDPDGNLIDSIFNGLPAGGQFSVTRGVNTVEPGELDGPSFVNVLPPTVPEVDAGPDLTVAEGTEVTLSATASDPDEDDDHTYLWQVVATNEQVVADGSGSTFSFTPRDNGTYTVTITTTDSAFLTDTDTVVVIVTNANPSATLTNAGPVAEGDPVSVVFTDAADAPADLAAGLHYSFALNPDDLADADADAQPGPAAAFTFPDDGTYTVHGRVIDKDGSATDYTTSVIVTNVVQTVGITGIPTDSVPTGVAVTLGSLVTDPGADAPFSYAWSVNGGPTAGTGPAFAFIPPGAGDYTVTLTVTDKDGIPATVTETFTAPGGNRPPVITSVTTSAGSESPTGEDQPVRVTARFTDPDTGDTHTAVIDWGDGTTSIGVVSAETGTVTGSHLYATGGEFTVTVAVIDRAGDSDTGSTTAHVGGVRLTPTGELQVVGTPGRDLVHVHRHDGIIRVHTKLAHTGGEGDCDDDSDDENENPHFTHRRYEFDASAVASILVLAHDGNDHVTVGSRVAVPARIEGGRGNDYLRGGGGSDTIIDTIGNNRIHAGGGDDAVTTGGGDDRIWAGDGSDRIYTGDGTNRVYAGEGSDTVLAGGGCDHLEAGSGNDILVGGAGDDVLIGDGGRDLLIGGFGADRLVGNTSEDILIGGYTNYDTDPAALSAILGVWTGTGSYQSRVAPLQASGFAHHLIANVTVHDDEAVDRLTGSAGTDWFFANVDSGVWDQITDLGGNETTTDVGT